MVFFSTLVFKNIFIFCDNSDSKPTKSICQRKERIQFCHHKALFGKSGLVTSYGSFGLATINNSSLMRFAKGSIYLKTFKTFCFTTKLHIFYLDRSENYNVLEK